MNMALELKAADFIALSPLFIILIGSLILLLIESFAPIVAKKCAAGLTLIILILALYGNWAAAESTNILLTPWLRFDTLGKFFTTFFILIGFSTTLLSTSFFRKFEASHGEYYFLLLSALFGLILIGSSADFLTLFLGIEILSVSLYILCGYMKKWNRSQESSIKYFLMGSLAAAFLLYGIAMIYGSVGTTQFESLLHAYQNLSQPIETILFLSGIALITLALFFEATLVPAQFWAPDVYEGSPTPITSFMAVGTKLGAFAAFVRIFFEALPEFNPDWNHLVAWLIYPTLIYANLLALKQTQIRRFFAYSGISHAAFLLIPVVVGTPLALTSLLFYLVIYAFSTIGAFAVISIIDFDQKGPFIDDLRGLLYKSPLAASILTLCLLTLAGIPPTIGFFAKFYIFQIAFENGYHGLVIVSLLTSILAAYYYLRIIGVMFIQSSDLPEKNVETWPIKILSVACCSALIILSLFPRPFIEILNAIGLKD